ncbi:MAG TPA: (Fe-S)-binding protein [Bacteroidales bacterium]|jgi:L-lactate dehydrogenase complex protein LldE|nr:(Fe-S)-binding protein [Bacteroidales bacterium]HQA86212.1 (Fe-S)-binding protein [Bacteroidales bacterium]
MVNLFIPCEMDMFTPSTAWSVINVLEKIGEPVIYNPEQTCCGRKFYYEGDIETARELGRKMIREFDLKYPIITPGTACVGYIKKQYAKLFENIEIPAEIKKFTESIFELCHYIVYTKGIEKLNNTFNHRVFYFKSCTARNIYQPSNAPEILLQNTKGLDLLLDPSMNDCCGANNVFAIANPEVEQEMVKNIVHKIYSMGAQFVTSTDIECLQHIDAYVQAHGIGLEVIHIADILNADLH